MNTNIYSLSYLFYTLSFILFYIKRIYNYCYIRKLFSLGILENQFIFCWENNVYAAYLCYLNTEYSLYTTRGYRL